MPKLNDTQLILLSTAAQRDGGSLHPFPETLADTGDRATKAIAALIKRSLAEERETNDATCVHRTDGDLRFGVFVTGAGMAAIDAGCDGAGEEAVEPDAIAREFATQTAVFGALAGGWDPAIVIFPC